MTRSVTDDILTVSNNDGERKGVTFGRKYNKIKILATPKEVVMSDFKMEAVTSADVKQLKNLHCCDSELKKLI